MFYMLIVFAEKKTTLAGHCFGEKKKKKKKKQLGFTAVRLKDR